MQIAKPERLCVYCGKVKPARLYSPTAFRRGGYCRACRAQYNRQYRSRSRSRKREGKAEREKPIGVEGSKREWQWRKRGIKLTYAEYLTILDRQTGRCAICARVSKRWCVNYERSSGRVRGILCCACHSMVGMARGEASILMTAGRYLS